MVPCESWRSSLHLDAKHAEMGKQELPSRWVERFAPLIAAQGTVLDLACGAGRHSRYLLALGYHVVAVDIDVSGVADLAGAKSVEVIQADLERHPWPFVDRRFDGIVVTNYLHRPRLSSLADLLAPGGVLIFETFAIGNERYGRPRNPDFLLEPNELLGAFSSRLTIVAYEHGFEPDPRPAMRQRICAIRPRD